jgi:UDP-N-acetylglucosamine 1-carboxyvinyltransferase
MNIKVKGGQVLSGEITPSGSKNSAVAIIPSTILFNKIVTIENVPEITDVERLLKMLKTLGSKVVWDKKKKIIKIDNSKLTYEKIKKSEVGNMRGTSLFWGPMLARFGRVGFEELPGGCTLGVRSLNPHYDAFSQLGVKIQDDGRSVYMDAKNAKAAEIWLTEMSPTVTENVLSFAVSLAGETKIIGAASEPQVQDLCNFFVKCGANISGIGSSILIINGAKKLNPETHKLLSDHYEIATFLAMAAISGGKIKINNAMPELFTPIRNVFNKFGINIIYDGESAIVNKNTKIKLSKNGGRGTLAIKAQPWPALPVDTLPLFIPIALAADYGSTLFHNWMYESGLFWTSELTKLGANVIMADPHRVIVSAGNRLYGATLEAPYIIRAVVAMVMAAMIAQGETTILNADALYRGHPHFSENLKKLGANINEIK